MSYLTTAYHRLVTWHMLVRNCIEESVPDLFGRIVVLVESLTTKMCSETSCLLPNSLTKYVCISKLRRKIIQSLSIISGPYIKWH
jgi:hypothetical protein